MSRMTLLLSRSDLERLLDVRSCIEELRQGFTAPPPGIDAQRVRTDLPGPGTATALIPGLVDGIPAYTVQVHAKFPSSRPALRGVVCLHDLQSGDLLAVLDSATVTAWRTGLAAALGTDILARAPEHARTVAGHRRGCAVEPRPSRPGSVAELGPAGHLRPGRHARMRSPRPARTWHDPRPDNRC